MLVSNSLVWFSFGSKYLLISMSELIVKILPSFSSKVSELSKWRNIDLIH